MRSSGRADLPADSATDHLFRRSMESVRPVRQNPNSQVSVLPPSGIDAIVPYRPVSP